MRAELVNFVVGILIIGFSLEFVDVAAETRRQARDVLFMQGDGHAIGHGCEGRQRYHTAVTVIGSNLERTTPSRRIGRRRVQRSTEALRGSDEAQVTNTKLRLDSFWAETIGCA